MCMQFFVKYFSLFSFPMQYNYQERSQLVGGRSDQQWSFPPEIGVRNWFAIKSQKWFVNLCNDETYIIAATSMMYHQ